MSNSLKEPKQNPKEFLDNAEAKRRRKNVEEILNNVNNAIKKSIPGEYKNAKAMFRQNIVEDLEEGDDDVALKKYGQFMENPRQYLMNMEEKEKEDNRFRITNQMERDPYSLVRPYKGGRRRTKRSKKSNRRTRRHKK